MTEEELSEFSFLLLDDNHIIKPFDCDDIDLNEFLFEKAKLLLVGCIMVLKMTI